MWPEMELVTRMSPVPRSIMCGRTARIDRKTPFTFTSTILAQASGSPSATSPGT